VEQIPVFFDTLEPGCRRGKSDLAQEFLWHTVVFSGFNYEATGDEISPSQGSASVQCRTQLIIAHAPGVLYARETHVVSLREVYSPPGPSTLLTCATNCLPKVQPEARRCSPKWPPSLS
jgi:hypothetical protein